jgi:CRISPR-associated endonuclease/helicase Cas3
MNHSQPWGKFDRESGRRHHLAHHCADVAACFLGLVSNRVIRARLEGRGRALSPLDIDRLGVLVFLHDSGKLRPGFQVGRGLERSNGRARQAWTSSSPCRSACGTALHLDNLCAWVDESLLRSVWPITAVR